MHQPPPLILEKVTSNLRRALVLWGLGLLVTSVATVSAVTWWLTLRTANDRLLSEGAVVSALIADIEPNRLGPDEMTVVFVWMGNDLKYTVPSQWFRGWNPDIEGDRIAVFFHPDHPSFVRIAEQRNYHPLASPSALFAPLLALGLVAAVRRSSRAHTAARTSSWLQTRVSVVLRGYGRLIRVALDGEELTPVGRSAFGRNLEPGPGWVCRHKDSMVAYHEPSGRVIVANLIKIADATT